MHTWSSSEHSDYPTLALEITDRFLDDLKLKVQAAKWNTSPALLKSDYLLDDGTLKTLSFKDESNGEVLMEDEVVHIADTYQAAEKWVLSNHPWSPWNNHCEIEEMEPDTHL